MDAQVFGIWFVLPIVLLLEAALVRYSWRQGDSHFVPGEVERAMTSLAHNKPGVAVILALWLVLTFVAWAYEFVFGLVLLHLVLFSLGRAAAAVALVAFAATLALTPVGLARFVLKVCHHGATATRPAPTMRA